MLKAGRLFWLVIGLVIFAGVSVSAEQSGRVLRFVLYT